jgi:hypothetical protein
MRRCSPSESAAWSGDVAQAAGQIRERPCRGRRPWRGPKSEKDSRCTQGGQRDVFRCGGPIRSARRGSRVAEGLGEGLRMPKCRDSLSDREVGHRELPDLEPRGGSSAAREREERAAQYGQTSAQMVGDAGSVSGGEGPSIPANARRDARAVEERNGLREWKEREHFCPHSGPTQRSVQAGQSNKRICERAPVAN